MWSADAGWSCRRELPKCNRTWGLTFFHMSSYNNPRDLKLDDNTFNWGCKTSKKVTLFQKINAVFTIFLSSLSVSIYWTSIQNMLIPTYANTVFQEFESKAVCWGCCWGWARRKSRSLPHVSHVPPKTHAVIQDWSLALLDWSSSNLAFGTLILRFNGTRSPK